ncbi:multiple sugar transport system permease protein/raffinose/stachyose/melibiose transport system permease protein [Kribbella sp. VKM Ac-2527]|uniref:Multiple sugar transport system permease protein/raffinose/stachyose/melibiose transport system permease protein n=1 Tax=Kribbella caucasensis TaxID=2512215 RepID=A0A4V3CAP1_9ACTN|nr:sugar ABC transporter permease [Kribbella sp. VKM Ac-2527]TDO51672.1 multiple sugar transport system permease protein/raffinose/stachyose/melibiose transport system permease protein [Kribbella sp. VKM Ac-2527]
MAISVFSNRRATALLVMPALAIYTAVMLVPIVWSAIYSFMDGGLIGGFTFTGFDNYTQFFTDPQARSALRFTAIYAVAMTIGQVALGYLLSLLYLFHLRRSSTIVRTLVFFPVVLPTVAVALLFQRVFGLAPVEGPVNALIQTLGGTGIDWLGGTASAVGVLFVMDLWRSMGFYAVLLYAGLMDIPEEMIEAARLDGATGSKLVRHVVLPMLLPVLVSALVFSINGTMKVFDSIIALTGGGPAGSTTPLTLYMFQTAFGFGEYGYGSTIAMVLTLLSLIVTWFILRSTRRHLTAS